MRCLITNPDGLGDLVLRQGLFSAIQQAGHQLMIFARHEHWPLLPQIAGEARCHPITLNPYLFDEQTLPAVPDLEKAMQEFVPDVCIVAPYQRTVLDERIVKSLPHARIIMQNGPLYRQGGAAQSNLVEERPIEIVETPESQHEFEKARCLGRHFLGHDISIAEPVLTATSAQIALANDFRTQHGLGGRKFYCCCIADDKSSIREWKDPEWISVFQQVITQFDHDIVIVGLPSEEARLNRVRQEVGPDRCHVAAHSELGLPAVAGLIAQSAGYLGRDAGPMHLAAALGRPVIALFSGVHWPRFTPIGSPSIALTVQVECSPCNGLCWQADSFCIKEIQVADVVAAVERNQAAGLRVSELKLLKFPMAAAPTVT